MKKGISDVKTSNMRVLKILSGNLSVSAPLKIAYDKYYYFNV